MQQAAASPAVVQTLLQQYYERPPLPARAPLYVAPSPTEGGGGGSTVIRFVRTAAGAEVDRIYTAFPFPRGTGLHTNEHVEAAGWAHLDCGICLAACRGEHTSVVSTPAPSCCLSPRTAHWLSRLPFRCRAASVLWLPYTAFTLLVRSSAASSSPLADTGEALLLMLACHAPAAGLLPPNPFRSALQQLQVRPARKRSPPHLRLQQRPCRLCTRLPCSSLLPRGLQLCTSKVHMAGRAPAPCGRLLLWVPKLYASFMHIAWQVRDSQGVTPLWRCCRMPMTGGQTRSLAWARYRQQRQRCRSRRCTMRWASGWPQSVVPSAPCCCCTCSCMAARDSRWGAIRGLFGGHSPDAKGR